MQNKAFKEVLSLANDARKELPATLILTSNILQIASKLQDFFLLFENTVIQNECETICPFRCKNGLFLKGVAEVKNAVMPLNSLDFNQH